MQLTTSYLSAIPGRIRDRYEIREVRNASAVLAAVAPDEFGEILEELERFKLLKSDLTTPGGNKSPLAARVDEDFRKRGWREGRHDLTIDSTVTKMPYAAAGEKKPTQVTTTETSGGYKVDNLKGRVALDVEWNAKDGNLHRDLTAYRVFYEQALIDVAVLITRTANDMRDLSLALGGTGLGGATTTNLTKLEPLLARGSSPACVRAAACAVSPSCRRGRARSHCGSRTRRRDHRGRHPFGSCATRSLPCR